ncbi:hypothetical protein TrRE_jg6063, partial [Triparma retinervis]
MSKQYESYPIIITVPSSKTHPPHHVSYLINALLSHSYPNDPRYNKGTFVTVMAKGPQNQHKLQSLFDHTDSCKVLQDVIRTMLARSFVEELFRPQEMYTTSSTRQIFNKLAHSSIMRINETSMDKLFDLMTMGVKYQWISCNVPQQMVQSTYNHLTALRQISEGSEVAELVDSCSKLVKETYCNLSVGNWYMLHQQM